MKVRDTFLANYAENREGLAFVTGGFPEWWRVQAIPIQSNLSMVIALEFERSEAETQFEFAIRVQHPTQEIDTLSLLTVTRGLKFDQPPNSPLYQVLAVPLSVLFRMEGTCVFRVDDVANQTLATVDLFVQLIPPADPSPEQLR
jgi:hypothetical protein